MTWKYGLQLLPYHNSIMEHSLEIPYSEVNKGRQSFTTFKNMIFLQEGLRMKFLKFPLCRLCLYYRELENISRKTFPIIPCENVFVIER